MTTFIQTCFSTTTILCTLVPASILEAVFGFLVQDLVSIGVLPGCIQLGAWVGEPVGVVQTGVGVDLGCGIHFGVPVGDPAGAGVLVGAGAGIDGISIAGTTTISIVTQLDSENLETDLL